MDTDTVKNNIKKLSAEILRIETKAGHEGRVLSRKEEGWIAEAQGSIEELKRMLPEKPRTLQNGVLGVGGTFGRASAGPYALVTPSGDKQHKALFGNDGYKWPDKETNFFAAVFSGRHHPGLIRGAMTESVPSSGGFLVPTDTVAKIHAVSLENEIIMPRCYVQPMRANTIKIPAMSIGDHSTALFGGFTASYVAEAGSISEADPKARAMELQTKKLTGLIRFSAELDADTQGGFDQIVNLCGQGLAWYRDKAFLRGTGAGQPLGILNASCTVEVAKEAGQTADTIVYQNLIKMAARLFAGSFNKSVWIAHQSTIPQLLSLSLAIGTGGSHIPVMQESGGEFTILTRPVLFTEKLPVLGDKGDILLADLSQYVVGLKNEMRFDTSIHVHFTTDELLSRIIERHSGQPLWDEPLTLQDGSTTVSPFVVLAERA